MRMKIFTLLSFFALLAFAGNAQIVDPNLETGTGGYWNESSTNFGTPLCDAGCGTCGGPCFAQDGAWYAWFGGAGGYEEVGSFNQDLTIPSGSSAELSFYAKITSGGSGSELDIMRVQMDGTTYWEITAADSADYGDYTLVTMDVSAFADGGNHWLNFEGDHTSGLNSNMLVDNLSLTVDGNDAVGINELLNKEEQVVVYPNPAINEVNVAFNHVAGGKGIATIYNLEGKKISQEIFSDIQNKQFTLDTSLMENGLYLMEVEIDGKIVSKRFMVQK